jgi:hypothetical protein
MPVAPEEREMTLTLTPELEAALAAWAAIRQTTPEAVALDALSRNVKPPPFAPRDEWERKLLAIGIDCGVSLTNEQLSRETMYD